VIKGEGSMDFLKNDHFVKYCEIETFS